VISRELGEDQEVFTTSGTYLWSFVTQIFHNGYGGDRGIPMGTNCSPLLADLFLYSYEADFIQGLLKKNEKKLARFFNFTFRYIDDVLSLNSTLPKGIIFLWYPLFQAQWDRCDQRNHQN
jgi:hypothetical protein